MATSEGTRKRLLRFYSPEAMANTTTLPSFEEHCRESTHAIYCVPEGGLLVWPMFGPLTDIMVLDETAPPSEAYKHRAPYATRNPEDGTLTLHPIAQRPACYPLASSFEGRLGVLDDWAGDCNLLAEGHEWDYDDRGKLRSNVCICAGDCDRQRWYEEPPPPIVIRASTKPYVTMGDYVQAKHDMFQTLKDDIVYAQSSMFHFTWGVFEAYPEGSVFLYKAGLIEVGIPEPDGSDTKLITWYFNDGCPLWKEEAERVKRFKDDIKRAVWIRKKN